jgi:hypothetical protein
MVLRHDDRGVIAIGQPSHAWVSGQLARNWGNAWFGSVAPREEVCLAAEQHDIGMADWDLTPTRNPATGLPYSFTEMPLDNHVECWRAGPRQLLSQCRYASLLTARHGRRLYELRKLDELGDRDAATIRAFLAHTRAFENRVLALLAVDRQSAAGADPETVARNSQLLWTWDFLSLALCLDWAPCTAREVPAADGQVDVALDAGVRPDQLTLHPWPFAPATLTVRCEGRRLQGRFDSDDALQIGLERAPWETVEFELVPERRLTD